jgi:hypothetical protein
MSDSRTFVDDSIQINLIYCTQVILQDIAAKQCTRKSIALTYAMAIKSDAQGADKPDWLTINTAILGRWKMSGLEFIKKRAFDILDGKIDLSKQ